MNWIRNELKDAKEAGRELWSWARHKDWKKTIKSSVRPKYWLRWLACIIVVVLVGLVAFYRDKIVKLFEPHKEQIVDAPVSWLAPIGILILISFPPLFGHEVVLLIVGLIWGLWVGFGIAAAGTFLGEMACYYTFKYLLTAKARKIEEDSIMYACLARLMRDGGLGVVTLVRLSILPGHIVTAIQSTVGMRTWIYALAIILTLPKQIVVVYLGVLFGTTKDTASADQIAKERRISLSVFFATTLATIIAAYVVYSTKARSSLRKLHLTSFLVHMRARKLYPEVLADYEARKGLAEPMRHEASGSLPLGSVDDLEGQRDSIPMYQAAGRVGDPGSHAYDDPFDPPQYAEAGRSGVGSQRHAGDGRPDFSPLPTEEGFDIPHARVQARD